MKHLILILFSIGALLACKKQTPYEVVDADRYATAIKKNMRDSIASNELSQLDVDHMLFSHVDSVQLYIVQIPFKGENVQEHFVLLHTDKDAKIIEGRLVKLSGGITKDSAANSFNFNGSIVIYSLSGERMVQSSITNGYIENFNGFGNRSAMQPSSGNLPEVVVVGYVNNLTGSISLSSWMALMQLFNSGSLYETYYVPYTTGSGGGWSNTTSYSEPMRVDYETQYQDPAIDLQKYLSCFNSIPDDGATCSIEIFADIPVDNNPNKLLNWQTGSPGHSFIQLKKSKGSSIVQQSIGFYPKSGWKTTLTNAPVEGKFVDNGGHEFNASFRMNLTPQQLRTIIAEMQYLQNRRYDIDEFNCTDYALAIFNSVRSHPLEIPLYDIPGGMTARGTNTPQGLYNQLAQMKQNGAPEAAMITLTNAKGWVGGSKGPCN